MVAAVFAIAAAIGVWAAERYWGLWGLLRGVLASALWHRSARTRVSFSALLKVHAGDRYVLARTPLRPEAFGPFGGVYHVEVAAAETLDACEFNPTSSAPNERDLRGFVPGGRLLQLVRWFQTGRDRESADQCLLRELREELRETGADRLVGLIDALRFRFVRTVAEPPSRVPGRSYRQFRYFHVYELDPEYAQSENFVAAALEEAASNVNLLAVTSANITAGRVGTAVIAHHAEYLFRRRASRPDLPQPIR